jgi:putative FmdB family regulatory protein
MPLYEYECTSCEHRFELIQRFSDPPAHACPKCGSPVKKLLSSPAIQFKGSGWYITDYARKGGATESPAPKSDSKAADKSSTDKGTGDASSSTPSSSEKPAPKTGSS